MQARDTQKARLYRAEDACCWMKKDGRTAPDFPDVKAAERYINKLRNSAWAKRRWPKFQWQGPVSVQTGHGCNCSTSGNRITLSRWGYTYGVVLHELAHAIIARERRLYPGAAYHGREFCAVYLQLVQHKLGKPAADELRARFKAWGVKYKAKRILSPEAKARALANLQRFTRSPVRGATAAVAAACPPADRD